MFHIDLFLSFMNLEQKNWLHWYHSAENDSNILILTVNEILLLLRSFGISDVNFTFVIFAKSAGYCVT